MNNVANAASLHSPLKMPTRRVKRQKVVVKAEVEIADNPQTATAGVSNKLRGKRVQKVPQTEKVAGVDVAELGESSGTTVEVVKTENETDIPAKVVKFEPKHWREQLENITKMREDRSAAVDTLGAATCAVKKPGDMKTYRYQILLSLMLSSQTKDGVTSAAMGRLRNHGCTIDKIMETSPEDLGALIQPVNFWKKKVEYIRRTTEIVVRDYESDIPKTPKELMALPGVGPKMAHLAMELGWDKITGIAVDTHVHRVSNRMGWTPSWMKDPEQTRKCLEDWLPRDLWSNANLLLVGFGQQTCLPIGPKCGDCLNRHICLFAAKERRSPVKKAF